MKGIFTKAVALVSLYFFCFMPAKAQTNVSGNQSGTWTTAGSPYILTGAITVPAGQTLTIQAGVTVQFPQYNYNINVNGTLNATGTITDSIRFTGKFNSNSSNYGGTVYFNASSINCVMNYVRADSLGDIHAHGDDAMVYVNSPAKPTISHCRFTNTESSSHISIWSGGAENISEINGVIGLRQSSVAINSVLPKQGTGAYYTLLGDLTINAGITLTMQPGVVLEFPNYNYDIIVNGSLNAVGLAGDSIRFKGKYSASNSNYGGTVYFNDGSSGSVIDYLRADSLGDIHAHGDDGVFYISASSKPGINHSLFTNTESSAHINTWYGGSENVHVSGIIGIRNGSAATNGTLVKQLTNGYYKLMGDLTINAGITVTLQPGVIVQFPSYGTRLIVNGTLNAAGTSTDSIYFKGTYANASSNYGGIIYFKAGSDNSTLNYIRADSLGDVNYWGDDGVFNIDAPAKPTIQHCLITNTESSVHINTWPGGAANTGQVNGIIGLRNGNLTVNSSLPKQTSNAYYRILGDITVDAGITLTMQPGTVIQFPRNSYRMIINGTLNAVGTPADSIYFKGTYANTSSNYGSAVYFNAGSSSSVLSYVRADSLGDVNYWGDDGVFNINSPAKPTIGHSLITHTESSVDIHTWIGGAENISGVNAIIGLRGGVVSINSSLPKQAGGAYYKMLGEIIVDAGVTLTMQPGSALQFPNNSQRLIINGTLNATGTLTDSIYFKGTYVSASSNYGSAVYFNAGSSSSVLNYVRADSLGDINYWGDDGVFNISSPAKPTIQNSLITHTESSMHISTWIGGAENLSNIDGIIGIQTSNVAVNSQLPRQSGNSYYKMLGNITVNAGITLTMKPGVKLQFTNNNLHLYVLGTLIANGTASDSIRFYGTAYNGNYYGGGISFDQGSAASSIQYARFDSLGALSSANYSVINAQGPLSLSNSLISNPNYYGVRINRSNVNITGCVFSGNFNTEVIALTGDTISPAIRQCTFNGNQYARTITANPGSISNVTDNTNAIIELVGTIAQNSAWQKPGPNSYYSVTSVDVSAGRTLSIQPGTSVKLARYNSAITIFGTLIANGTSADSIHFFGGRNGNETHSGNINFANGSINSSIQYASFDSLGYPWTTNYDATIRATGQLTISNSSIRNSLGYGLKAERSSLDLTNCSFSASGGIGYPSIYIQADSISPVIRYCSFAGNTAGKTISANPGSISNISDNTNAIIELNGTVAQHSTWKKPGPNSYYSVTNADVSAGKTLTIQAGTTIKLARYNSTINVFGTLVANGTITDSIHFSGGRNGNETHGGNINFNNGSLNSSIQYASFDSLGYPWTTNYDATIRATGPLTLNNSSIRNSLGIGVKVERSSLMMNNCSISTNSNLGYQSVYLNSDTISPVIQNCSFSGNENGRSVYAPANGLSNISSNINAFVQTNGTVSKDVVFRNQGNGSKIILTGTVTVSTSRTLTIEPGTTIDFRDYQGNLIVNGSLKALGQESNTIKFIKSPGTGVSNFGGRIDINSSSANSILSYCVIDKLGSNSVSGRALEINTSNISISNITVSNSEDAGIYISNSNPFFFNSSILNNPTGVLSASGKPVFNNCNIYNNTASGISNISGATADTVDARSCYWGTPTGPFHTTLNPSGTGNAVSNKVKFIPYKTNTTGGQLPDLAVTNLVAPVSGCDLGTTETITITIRNFGNAVQSNFPIGYRVNNGPVVTDTVAITLLPGQAVNYSFNTKANLNNAGTYTIKTFTLLPDDSTHTNDTLTSSVQNLSTLDVPAGLLPADSSFGLDLSVAFSWGAVNGATSYDLYLWQANDNEPSLPIASGLVQTYFTYNGALFKNGEKYKWKVAARLNTCKKESNVLLFGIKDKPDLIVKNITAPTVVLSGQQISVSWQVKDSSDAGTGNVPWLDHIWLSADTIVQDNPPPTDFYLGGIPNLTALLPGESYVNSATFTLPEGIGGTYYLIAKTNLLGTDNPVFSLNEKNKGNNIMISAPFQVNLAPSPDLHVASLILPINAFSGTSVNINWTVKNSGADIISADANWTDKVYISLSPVFNASTAALLAQYGHDGNLAHNDSYSHSASVRIPDYIFGSYYIYVQTDANKEVYEIPYENNNTSSDIINIYLTPPPDLAVQSFGAPTATGTGYPIDLSWIVKNAGATATDKSWSDRIYISPNSNYNPADAVGIGSIAGPSNILDADDSYSRQATFTIPNNLNGTYYLYVVTNADNTLFENNSTANNILRSDQPIQISSADLQVQSFTIPVSASSGGAIAVSAVIKNTGAFATTGQWTDRIYISANPNDNLSTALVIGEVQHTGNIAVGDSYTIEPTVTIPANYTGALYLYVQANFGNSLFENGLLQNNILRSDATIQINNPDLIPDEVTIPALAASGQSVSLSWKVNNTGSGDLFNASRTDSIYLSTHAVLDNAAVPITILSSAESIAAGGSILKQTNITIPNGLSGTYYAYIVTDATRIIYETNNDNNTARSASPVNITLGPSPDLIVQSMQLRDTVRAGFKMAFAYTVVNTGAGDASNTIWTDHVYISSSPVWQAVNARLINTYTRSQPLAAGSSYTITDSLLLAVSSTGKLLVNGHLLDSTFAYFYVVTDAVNSLFEYNAEGNNMRVSGAVYILPPRIDLEVTRVSGSDTAYSGQPAHAYWKVRNNGVWTGYKGVQFPDYWYDAIYLSRDTIWDPSDVFVYDWIYSNTPKDSSYHDTQNFTIPNGSSGDYYMLMVVDHKRNVPEEVNFSNNLKLIRKQNSNELQKLHVILSPSPDLVITQTSSESAINAGQPVHTKWTVKNNGIAVTGVSGWEDAVYLSADLVLDASDQLLVTRAHSSALQPGQFYTDSTEVTIPANASGNYVLIYKTDMHNDVYEHQADENNISYSLLNINTPPPSDLVVVSVQPPSAAIAGDSVSITYKIRNNGGNPAAGIMTDGIYLSSDTVWDIHDQLIGTLKEAVIIAADADLIRTITTKITGTGIGYYKVIVRTDLLNNIIETNDANNKRASIDSIHITVRQLPIAVLTADSLINENYLYYRIEIPDSLAGQTLLISLKGDSLNANNELFARYAHVPSRSVYDFSHGTGTGGNQELLIPVLQAGTYYIAAFGNNTVANKQTISLYASVLPFAIRKVQSDKGGNTGTVTLQINGSKFEPGMQLKLRSVNTTIIASSVYFINTTTLFASFNLTGQQLGFYDVVARKADTSEAILVNGFEIITGSGGGFYVSGENGNATPGCDPGAANGVNALVQTGAQYPANTRRNRVIAITIFFGNSGNVDIPVPTRFLHSTAGAPLSFDVAGLAQNSTDLYLEFKEVNGPPNILRAGATGSITVYTKAVAPLSFLISD